ncbi:MAG TPA: lysylphosphatidylglycerol synthase domain-containing protein, partial [Polyangiaceae bacterium]|nr:lysylphosphatidylglycerol synthase domain-containing protein [Polyangiaceae bacterium]
MSLVPKVMGEGAKKWLRMGAKLAVAAAIIALIFHKIFERQEADALWAHVAELRYGLVVLCAVSFAVAIAANVLRWNLLLDGQGIHAPPSYLISTFMIARFFGAAGGLIGQSGFRLYDLSRRTGKTARAAASIGIELVIGNMAMGAVSLISCLFGMRYVGETGVLVLALSFGALIAVTFTILAKPRFVRALAQRLPRKVAARLQSAVDAVCAYEGKGGLLARAVLYGVVVHVGNNLVYVLAAKALGVDLPVSELFFVSTLQNIVSHLPITPNGVGLREMTAVGLYAAVGLPPEQAVLIPIVGFSVDMAISSLGGVALLLRRESYAPAIVVDEAERESMLDAHIERALPEQWPLRARGAALGAAAGVCAGLCVGLLEAGAIALVSHGQADADVWFFGALSYALLCGLAGATLGALTAQTGRWMEREAWPEPQAFGHYGAVIAALFSLVLGAFRLQRDVYHEELVWKSARGIGVLLSVMLSAALVYLVTAFLLSRIARLRAGRVLTTPQGAGVLGVLVVGVCFGVSLAGGAAVPGGAEPAHAKTTGAAKTAAGNVLFVVVDTLRADHLPMYGYSAGKTPRLDAFARDALRFEQAYANASWTRPSFASLLTGRYASSHGVMSKAASLPDEATTIAEAFASAGYHTGGIVTNYNVAPFFNFNQGFHEYHYLAPHFLFGASDTAAKLSLLQILRRVDE